MCVSASARHIRHRDVIGDESCLPHVIDSEGHVAFLPPRGLPRGLSVLVLLAGREPDIQGGLNINGDGCMQDKTLKMHLDGVMEEKNIGSNAYFVK